MTPFGLVFVSIITMAIGMGAFIGIAVAYNDPIASVAFVGGMLFGTPWAFVIGRISMRALPAASGTGKEE